MTYGVRRQGRGSYVSCGPEETLGLGEVLGRVLTPHDVLVLTGDLGAGKTQLVKGVARGMGVRGDVTSPTFTIEMVYEGGGMPLYHFDLYRLDAPEQLDDVGLFDALGVDGPCLIEWGEQFADEIGDERVDVLLERFDVVAAPGTEPSRSIRFVAHTAAGEALIDRLDKALLARPETGA